MPGALALTSHEHNTVPQTGEKEDPFLQLPMHWCKKRQIRLSWSPGTFVILFMSFPQSTLSTKQDSPGRKEFICSNLDTWKAVGSVKRWESIPVVYSYIPSWNKFRALTSCTLIPHPSIHSDLCLLRAHKSSCWAQVFTIPQGESGKGWCFPSGQVLSQCESRCAWCAQDLGISSALVTKGKSQKRRNEASSGDAFILAGRLDE